MKCSGISKRKKRKFLTRPGETYLNTVSKSLDWKWKIAEKSSPNSRHKRDNSQVTGPIPLSASLREEGNRPVHFPVFTQHRKTSATLQACATHPRGMKGSAASKTSLIEPMH